MKGMLVATTVAAMALAGSVMGQDAPFAMQIKARQGIMEYRALNIGVLGAMAKGETPYDAAAAQKAADNLVMTTMIDMSMLWPEGSDHSANPASTADAKLWTAEADVAGRDVLEPGEHPERRRLAAARRPEDREELAIGAFQVEILHGLGLAVILPDVVDRYRGHRSSTLSQRPW